jgi:hypothetical protein
MNDSIHLEQIRRKEKSKRPFKGFLTYTFIQTTASKAQSEMYKVPADTFEKDFHPSWLHKGAIILVIGFTAFWVIGFLFQAETAPYAKLIVLPLLALIILLIYDGFFNAKKIYHFHLDFEGIRIGEELYQWTDIQQTAILQIGLGRGRKLFLVLLFHDDSYRKFNLQAFQTFWGFQNAISAYIEYFKKKALT